MEPVEPDIPVRDPAYEKTLCLFGLPAMLSTLGLKQAMGWERDKRRLDRLARLRND